VNSFFPKPPPFIPGKLFAQPAQDGVDSLLPRSKSENR
jgi:hypothetical protein